MKKERVKEKMDDSIKFLKAHIKLYLVFLISFGEAEDASGYRLKIYHLNLYSTNFSALAGSSCSRVQFSYLLRTASFQF